MKITNDANSVFAAIEEIAASPGKLQKEALIKEFGSESSLFMRVLKAAYDPFVTYGMRKVPSKTLPGEKTLDEKWPWEVLNDLASRKLSGTAAWDAVQRAVDHLNANNAELFIRIIRRDLRAGFTDGTINRVFPKTILEFPYMRCTLPPKSNMADWDWNAGIMSQEKADGMFVNVNVDSVGGLNITTRQGTPIPLDHIEELAAECALTLKRETQTHGEITVYKDKVLLPREEGNGVMNSICAGGELPAGHTLRIDAWDQIPMLAVQPKGKYEVPYKVRMIDVITQIKTAYALGKPQVAHGGVHAIATRVVRSKADALAHYRELLKLGKEGTICKSPMAIWKDGTSKDQVKLKLEVDVDLIVTEVLPGAPGTKVEGRPGALRCETSCGGLVVNVTIKNEDMRARVEAANDAFIGGIMPVRANSIMDASDADGLASLFLPRFTQDVLRTDKRVADTLVQVRDQFAAAVKAA